MVALPVDGTSKEVMPYAQIKRAAICCNRLTAHSQCVRYQNITTGLFRQAERSQIMYKHYYINNNQTLNPGLHHEVHTKEHAAQLGIRSTQYVGYFASEVEAVARAKKIYSDADGCATCCPKAHRG